MRCTASTRSVTRKDDNSAYDDVRVSSIRAVIMLARLVAVAAGGGDADDGGALEEVTRIPSRLRRQCTRWSTAANVVVAVVVAGGGVHHRSR